MAESGAQSPGRIFISYRREDTAYPAGWLYDRLADRYGGGQIFKDIDSIQLGDDFVEVITAGVGSCDVLLALVGDKWLTITDADGRRRLDDPEDFVRLEIEAALKRNIRVIPILVEGARMPRANEVPASLAALVRRQALELSPARFDFDTSRLLKVLDATLAEVMQDPIHSPGGAAPPVAAPPVPAPALTAATSAGAAVTGPATEPIPPQTGVDHPAGPQPRPDPRLQVAGQLAIAGAVLLVVGLFRAYIYTESLWQGRSDIAHMRWFALYLLAIATLALGAGACTLIPRTRRLVGPGLLLGVVAASTWDLVFLVSDRLRFNTALSDGWWYELVAHLVLVLAACLTGLALARAAGVRLVRSPPRGQPAWLVIILGCAGALALIFHDRYLWHPWTAVDRWHAAPSIWMTVMAAAVPAYAVMSVPRRFAVALLAGWIAGSAAFLGFQYIWDHNEYGALIRISPIITFGLTLLALLVVTVLFARATPRSQVEHTTPG
jgi:TIR domain